MVRPIGVGKVLRRIMGNCVTKVTKPNVIDASGSLRACAGHQSRLRQPFTQCGNFLNMTTVSTPDKLSFAAHVDTTLNSKAGTKSSTTSNDPIETPSLDGIMCPFCNFRHELEVCRSLRHCPYQSAFSSYHPKGSALDVCRESTW